MKKLILLLVSIPLISFGQTKEELQLCLAAQSSSFTSDSEADNALDKILNVIGASKNFVLTPCSEINNAMATSYKGIRYILYDKAFMKLINSKTNDWASLFILAHEVGHHINGHTLDLTMYAGGVLEAKTLEIRRKQEIEADEFAAFILAKLGAPLNSLESSIALISSDKDDTYSTHPSKSKRLNAVRTGYNKAGTSRTNNDYVVDNSTMSVEQYYNRGIKRMDSKDYYGAIQDFNQALRIKPDYELAYFQRAYSKYELPDYSGALRDYSKYIELDPDDVSAYNNRGIAKDDLKDYYGAIADYTKAIELNPDYASAYNNRGNVKFNLKDYNGAIPDYTKAIELNPDYASAYTNRGLAKGKLEDYYGAIADYTKTIELDPDYASAYTNRGVAKFKIGDTRNGPCADFRKAISLGSTTNLDWVRKNCN